jgi:hypothetical protein
MVITPLIFSTFAEEALNISRVSAAPRYGGMSPVGFTVFSVQEKKRMEDKRVENRIHARVELTFLLMIQQFKL